MAVRKGEHVIPEYYPMRAQSFDYMKATVDEWQDPNYIYEIKYDGERALLHFLGDTIAMTGRRVSDVTGHLHEKSSYIPHLTNIPIPHLDGTVIDGELLFPDNFDLLRSIMGSGTAERAIGIQEEKGYLQYIAYDILFYKGEDVQYMRFEDRRKLLDDVIAVYGAYTEGLVSIAPQYDPKAYEIKALFESFVAAGHEGLMKKAKDGVYKICDGSKKSAEVQKLKKLITLDGIVMGFHYGTGKYNQGRVATLEFGQIKDGVLMKRANFDGFSKELIDEMGADIQTFIGRVVEIKCNEILKSGKLRHPKFNRWRDDDKPFECCTWDEF